MTKMTINVRKKLLKLHHNRRRKRIADYVKQSVARFAKADKAKILISPELNSFLTVRISRKPVSFTIEVEKKEDRVDVMLPGAEKKQAAEGKKEKKEEKAAEKKAASDEKKPAPADEAAAIDAEKQSPIPGQKKQF